MPSLKDLYNLPSYRNAADATGYRNEPKQLENPQRYNIGAPEQTSSLRRLADLKKQDVKDSTNYARQQANKASNQGLKNVAENALDATSVGYYAKLLGLPDDAAGLLDYAPIGGGELKPLAIGMFGRKARKEAKEAEKWAKFDEIPGQYDRPVAQANDGFELRKYDAKEAAAKRAIREELERKEAIKRGRHSADSLANLVREPSEYGPFQASMYEPFELRPYKGEIRKGADKQWMTDSLRREMAARPAAWVGGVHNTSKEFSDAIGRATQARDPAFKEAYLRDYEVQMKLKDLYK